MIKLLGNIIYGMFILLLVAVVGLFLASRLNVAGGTQIKIVKSGSMEPAIHTGSIVLIKPTTSYAVGDVITFGEDTRSEIPTTHRIASVRKETGSTFYTTKGDANEEIDPEETHASKVIGKVLFTVPYAGYVLDFARQPMGFALLIGLPAMLIIFEGLFTIVKEARAIMRRRRGDGIVEMMDEEVVEDVSLVDVMEREQGETRAAEEIHTVSRNIVGGEIYGSPRPQQMHFATITERKFVDGIRPWNDRI